MVLDSVDHFMARFFWFPPDLCRIVATDQEDDKGFLTQPQSLTGQAHGQIDGVLPVR